MDAVGKNVAGRLRVLVLYDDWTAQTAAVYDQMLAFRDHSENHVVYALATREGADSGDVHLAERLARCFDVIVVHHSVRLYVAHYINEAWAGALAAFPGFKVLFIQDDYEGTETARRWMEKLGINALFTVVPEESWELVYPTSRFPNMEKQQVLTGYVPRWVATRQPVKPIDKRSRFIGYRAFKLPYYLGHLAREKFVIGQKMREICEARGIPVDIEWDPAKRIYGAGWYDFVEDSRATLGTESGSNVFDENGNLERRIDEALRQEPELTYEQIHQRFLSEHEGKVVMNQVSPRIFEAIALGSALVLFEGKYSGVVRPDEHFIPLKKDFSNVDEVLEKLRDTAGLEAMTRRAYADVIESGRYSYEAFVAGFDGFLRDRVAAGSEGAPFFWLSSGERQSSDEPQKFTHNKRQLWLTSEPFLSQTDCLTFFSSRGSDTSVKAITDMERDLVHAQSEVVRLTGAHDFLQSEIARLTQKTTDLGSERQKNNHALESLKGSANILEALTDSRWATVARLLGLCGPPPRPKAAGAGEYLQTLIDYIRNNRWLMLAARKNRRLGKAVGLPDK